MKTYVYLIQAGLSYIKIGVSGDPLKRLQQMQTAHGKPLRLLATIGFDSRKQAFEMERELHEKFRHLLVGGEWFRRCILREMKHRGKRIIGGTYKKPITRLSNEHDDRETAPA